MYECVARATNMMTGNKLDLKKILSYFEEVISDPNWLPIVRKTATDCLLRTTSKLANIKQLFDDASKGLSNKKFAECNIGVLAFTECHMTEMYTYCPDSSWTNTNVCNDAKMAADKCNNNVENVVMQYMVKVPK